MQDNKEPSGLKWLRENEGALNRQYPGEWVAISADGVEAHAASLDQFVRLARRKMALTPEEKKGEWLVHFVRGDFNTASQHKMGDILKDTPGITLRAKPRRP